jgi:circadian clock protein KaiC
MIQSTSHAPAQARAELPKAATGIEGLDQITGGGVPQGRPTLICGGAGCGKTLLAMEFLVRGATQFGEPGVFISFEEPEADLIENVRSLGFDLSALIEQRLLAIDHVQVERSEISASFSTRSKACFRDFRTPPSCGPSCGGCSTGLRSAASRRSSRPRKGKAS